MVRVDVAGLQDGQGFYQEFGLAKWKGLMSLILQVPIAPGGHDKPSGIHGSTWNDYPAKTQTNIVVTSQGIMHSQGNQSVFVTYPMPGQYTVAAEAYGPCGWIQVNQLVTAVSGSGFRIQGANLDQALERSVNSRVGRTATEAYKGLGRRLLGRG